MIQIELTEVVYGWGGLILLRLRIHWSFFFDYLISGTLASNSLCLYTYVFVMDVGASRVVEILVGYQSIFAKSMHQGRVNQQN